MKEEAVQICQLAARHGIEFTVHRGCVFTANHAPSNTYAQACVQTAWEQIHEYLLSTRGADAGALFDLYQSDRELQLEFPSLPELDDFSHAQALRLLKSAIRQMEISE